MSLPGSASRPGQAPGLSVSSADRCPGRTRAVGRSGNEPIGWDHPDTARYYARFQRRFERYHRANRRLVAEAAPGEGMRVLDVGAGDGATAAAALPHLGGDGSVVCFEPSAAMRALGEGTLRDDRVLWTDRWPAHAGGFDRVLCGAAIWQLRPLAEALRRIRGLLRPGGCLCFDAPGLYLGESDPPGGGSDPRLLGLPAALAADRDARAATGATDGAYEDPASGPAGSPGTGPFHVSAMDTLLANAGFRTRRWGFTGRLGQREYREWLKIPPTTDRLLRGVGADRRAALVDRAYRRVDASSWRWERWLGWTAWRPGA